VPTASILATTQRLYEKGMSSKTSGPAPVIVVIAQRMDVSKNIVLAIEME
jgi:hypothetical protein